MNSIQPYSGNMILLPHKPTINEEKRLGIYLGYLSDIGAQWHGNGDLENVLYGFKVALEDDGLMPSSISAYMGTIRSRYRKLLKSNKVRDLLFNALSSDHSPADAKAMVDEYILRMSNDLESEDLKVGVTAVQDRMHLRLTAREAKMLLNAPEINSLIGLRDRAIIATLLCTGIRVQEMVMLEREDLYQEYEGLPCLRVKYGKGNKSRMVPYGALDWFLNDVENWLKVSQIGSGYIFRSVTKGNTVFATTPLTTEAVRNILHSYPIEARGKRLTVNPHDLRRTYARRLFEAGMSTEAIQQNLGHAKIETTLHYIGDIKADMRASEVNPYE